MANILFLDGLWSDVATITATSEATGAPASNLLLMQPGDVTRTADGVLTVSYDLQGPSTGYDGVFMGYWNVTENGTKQIRTATSQANLTSAPAYSSATTPFWPQTDIGPYYDLYHSWHMFPSRRTETWVRITISDAGNPENYISGGVIRIGQKHQPERNVALGLGIGFHEPSQHSRSKGGTLHTLELPGWQRMELPFSFGTRTDAIWFHRICRLFGGVHPLWIHLNIDNTTDGYWEQTYGKILEATDVSRPEWNIYQFHVRLEETP